MNNLFSFSPEIPILIWFFFLLLGFIICSRDSFLIPYTNRNLEYLTKILIFHMRLSQVPERKRRVSFPCRKQVFLGQTKCNEVSKVSCLECLFQSRCPGPLAPRTGLRWFGPSAPQGAVGAHTGWKNKAGTLKKRVFWKGRLGWGVEETCCFTPAALIAAHSRWIIPCAYFNPPLLPPPLLLLLFWVKCDSPRCPRLIMRSGTALWWLNLLTYLLELGPDAEWGRHWKQYLSQRCYKPSLLLFISITCWPQLSDECVGLKRTLTFPSVSIIIIIIIIIMIIIIISLSYST